MNKQEFLTGLRMRLSGLPQEDIEERLAFYSEMIDDRIEEGLSEEEAINGIGSIESIVSQTVSDIPMTKLVKEKIKPKRQLTVFEILLLVLGAPIWLPLLISVAVVLLSIFISLWTVVLSIWLVFASAIALIIGSIIVGAKHAVLGNCLNSIMMAGAGLVCSGFLIFAFYLCKAVTKGAVKLSQLIALSIKNRLISREDKK